ncbi:hypothetical protein NM688_g8800 [Phlebia brevispora]|uniref:Uncharacterized protein n=1 Tax=Phlebia brevispora TaxID=194682 RepID=A0ACC1RNF7_9APHY|nr:hypothetical protein NM688_g8800 [Phlebia brevispora]
MAESSRSPSLKRKRSDTIEIIATPNNAYRKHDFLWYTDGNLAVLAEDTHFRLHEGILALHSDVFRDMLMLPRVDLLETLDGCPVVRLTDRASDLAVFFTALYGAGKRSWYNPKVSVTFSEVRVILTLGMKYQVQHLVDEALFRLRKCFPASLSEWDQDLHARDEYPPIRIVKEDAIAVVNLARRFHLPDLLLSAFYTLSQLPKNTILTPVHYGADDYEQLCPMDLQIYLGGLDGLLSVHRYLHDILAYPAASDSCRYPDTCQSLLDRLPARFMAAGFTCCANPLFDYTPWIEETVQEMPGSLCLACDTFLKRKLDECRQKVWHALPAIFGVM